MRNLCIPVAIFACASLVQAAGAKKYGKPMVLAQETKISELLAKPDAFNGKRVRVSGLVLDVCDERGCYLTLAGDRKGQRLLFKVDDGVIVFPASARGSKAIAEGIFSKRVFSVAELKEMCVIEAKAMDPSFDPEAIKGPMTVYRLDGIGAELR